MLRLLIPVLFGFTECSHSATSADTGDTAGCTSADPCARVTGFSCEAGAEVEEPFEGGLVHAMAVVYVVEARDEIAPWDLWTQDTDGTIRFTCPGETTLNSGYGNVLVYYYET